VTRPRAEVAGAHEDAAWCIRELHIRRWKYTVIAGRLGVSVQTVHRWKVGESAPATERQMQRLISLTRAVLQMPPPVTRLVGMPAVVETLRVALGLSARGLSRRLAMGESAVANWRHLNTLPGRVATHKLRALVVDLEPKDAPALLSICDARLRRLAQECARDRLRSRRRNFVFGNRAAVAKLKERQRANGRV
jgi:DNA-binding transcriptional regulator YiaG